ncbi:MAG TPA: hypothetical protein O0X85_03620, partial [Methanocorpusculum sp.]|nr:hypothetical protein [Methanocorpusculum sp.]
SRFPRKEEALPFLPFREADHPDREYGCHRQFHRTHVRQQRSRTRDVPKKPATRSSVELIEKEETKLDLAELIEQACASAELWIARDGTISRKMIET